MSFGSHGTLTAHIDGRILVVQGKGPWNLESLNESADIVRPLLDSLYGPPWGVLGIFSGDPLYVPDAAKLITDTVIREKSLGRIASAVVVAGSTAPEMGRFHISDIYQRAGETFAFFDTAEAGKSWLLQQLAEASAG